ncbi:hypothetical protein HYPSUDRAFT_662557 [Hypholoma sublateritium FD-334 SS-4]|uniref:Uncharacterized protein n=1 Tax=Hypholoma sublateritium (strain FD-334 SS-4) TaxID=945553 RepID=A0A0D2NTX9_HYPSF|nr:hypothetical protein HYPSUDRAFT_662557 [Hypholoma sublateritium FD-334 SS-4]
MSLCPFPCPFLDALHLTRVSARRCPSPRAPSRSQNTHAGQSVLHQGAHLRMDCASQVARLMISDRLLLAACVSLGARATMRCCPPALTYASSALYPAVRRLSLPFSRPTFDALRCCSSYPLPRVLSPRAL